MNATLTQSLPAEDGIATPPLNRMVMAVLALAGLVIATYMYLYKVGAIPAVACGTGSCETVQGSPWAVFLGVPVPLIGVIGYASILAVAMAGVQPALAADRRVSGLLLGLATIAFGFSVYLSGVEAFLIGAWCRWCIGSAIVATLLFACALPEVRRLRKSGP